MYLLLLCSYQCPHCPLNFYSKNNWGKHVNVHTKEKKYVCPVCDKVFLRSDNLKRHKQSHLEGQTYKCSYCPKTYRNRTGLLIHRMTHTQSPDIPCDGCDKKFYTKWVERGSLLGISNHIWYIFLGVNSTNTPCHTWQLNRSFVKFANVGVPRSTF